MSWTRGGNPYQAFQEPLDQKAPPIAPRFQIEMWRKRVGEEDAQHTPTTNDIEVLTQDYELRIIFASLDLPRKETKEKFIQLFELLGVPKGFVEERMQSVCHSFGTQTDDNGVCAWFHFLCKYIRLRKDPARPDAAVEVVNHREAMQRFERLRPLAEQGSDEMEVPQADFSYLRSGFFIRTTRQGATTLAIFGATRHVKARLNEFISNKAWADVAAEPLVLFDLILEGLYKDVDENVWNMADIFGPMENNILVQAHSREIHGGTSQDVSFAGLHNVAKHVIYLAETIESNLLVLERLLTELYSRHGILTAAPAHSSSANSGTTPSSNVVQQQLRDRLRYRQSLFRSTKLRLTSLQKRIENAITLAFNQVTQQDSKVLLQDSSSMKIIAAITMLFLPITAVSAILSSQFFLTNNSDGAWRVSMTPLFPLLWATSLPLTGILIMLGFFWHKWPFTNANVQKATKEVPE